ncbi:MAG: hypothetical protein QOI24_2273 [Acidobacteriota bacterium]|nr:hypothetical protein [Acidobacteriota bacterium]
MHTDDAAGARSTRAPLPGEAAGRSTSERARSLHRAPGPSRRNGVPSPVRFQLESEFESPGNAITAPEPAPYILRGWIDRGRTPPRRQRMVDRSIAKKPGRGVDCKNGRRAPIRHARRRQRSHVSRWRSSGRDHDDPQQQPQPVGAPLLGHTTPRRGYRSAGSGAKARCGRNHQRSSSRRGRAPVDHTGGDRRQREQAALA